MYELTNALSRIARSKTIPFCYGCYIKAPTGRCNICASDDLMLLYPNHGVEYGAHWIIQALPREHLSPANTAEAFERSVAACYPETVKIGWTEYDLLRAVRELDPVAWNLALSEFIDNEIADENLITFDSGETYYWTADIVNFIETN